VLIEKGNSTGH